MYVQYLHSAAHSVLKDFTALCSIHELHTQVKPVNIHLNPPSWNQQFTSIIHHFITHYILHSFFSINLILLFFIWWQMAVSLPWRGRMTCILLRKGWRIQRWVNIKTTQEVWWVLLLHRRQLMPYLRTLGGKNERNVKKSFEFLSQRFPEFEF